MERTHDQASFDRVHTGHAVAHRLGLRRPTDDQPESTPEELLEQELADSKDEGEFGDACGESGPGDKWGDKKEPPPPNPASYGAINPPPGEKDPNYCVNYSIGDGTTCIPYDDIKLKLTEACRAEGLELTELRPERPGILRLQGVRSVCCLGELLQANPVTRGPLSLGLPRRWQDLPRLRHHQGQGDRRLRSTEGRTHGPVERGRWLRRRLRAHEVHVLSAEHSGSGRRREEVTLH